ncbi:nucleotide-diphospho-sugar transferase [Thamnocephalis sphaerospora]|uniref:dolichyl-phosphate beta-glucosyltransferase n=1 Tax=Thamnocephalis sphaerospora TaxID=78915 RepID=A0A4P9XRC4_9FUNG|nr:nucleotide-diphospho-sugar transferase [Thamnocephalis sphaerospora]|eukprot:RKP08482.1 nucleotide-diphospho-sugar transferase [Thamnocephalis sphaerospora]
MTLATALLYLLALGVCAAISICVYLVVTSPPKRVRTAHGLTLRSSKQDVSLPLPDIADNASVTLSVVVPAYNEEERLPLMLDETVGFLDQRKKSQPDFTYEILVVDDGSRDRTSEMALEYAKKHENEHIRVLTLAANRGKGGAVAEGMLRARGERLLFADADGATKFADIEGLESELAKLSSDGLGVVVGSRAHMVRTDAVVKRSAIRNFLMHSFHQLLYVLGVREIKDTQCGFKLFTRSAARSIFRNVHVEGWIFDVEVLLIAMHCGIPIGEVPVTWHEIDGSKVSLLRDSIRMALDLFTIRLNYLLGVWAIDLAATSKQQ